MVALHVGIFPLNGQKPTLDPDAISGVLRTGQHGLQRVDGRHFVDSQRLIDERVM